jgi:hypothetical protein
MAVKRTEEVVETNEVVVEGWEIAWEASKAFVETIVVAVKKDEM